MRLSICLLSAAAFFEATASEAASIRDIETSWGRSGVTYAEYRSDAAACEKEAASTEIAGTPEVRELVKASRALDNVYASAWMAYPAAAAGMASPTGIVSSVSNPGNAALRVSRSFAVEDNIQDVRAMLQKTMDACLLRLGYRQFRLTSEQRERLKKLPLRSARRHLYLHGLARDPNVLQAQGL
ncbi:hypothetical protein LZ016_10455 [Sphingomonas sp. SM33]|uniref:Uncharacterized protein n=1 Tax=Sphingomonas telluris TaxID=2907998 RepID=A0ABS9VNG7_9SPHN|nr:hypothetical protein [Sphingomonas telluris]MCH8616520.1 hypothetical protein [Sphingomonas telluris]